MAEAEEPAGPVSVAVDTVVRELASMAVIAAVSWAILHRDTVARVWARMSARPVSPAEARERRLVAELRAAVSRWEHRNDRAPTVPGDGLYGGG